MFLKQIPFRILLGYPILTRLIQIKCLIMGVQWDLPFNFILFFSRDTPVN